MKTVSAAEANRQFSKLLRAVREGETVTITSHGKPVARLVGAKDDEMEEARNTGWLELVTEMKTRRPRPTAERLPGKFNRDWAYED